VELWRVPGDYVRVTDRQIREVRHGPQVSDSCSKDLSGWLTDLVHRFVMVLAQGAQLFRPEREFHAYPE
jgi:hypothetical protein